ncbi:glycosyltransferase family 4 protein [Catenuloplanes atrovinosus]|uniref:Glycosyltransferase involved in cell wall biosynthesis n=1 Tax=Catenuloplanes atrovinosus TaxID=137266 RepID=A0AAE3YZQ7_9ACTN|nr:glycosyltransferase family 4 protein [Catenuloplanes atrovinosus]MDR7281106.1 glycosyltransferase involved in cell wall biosynthesis [Catenuloplanes atrovinosus]
MARDRRPHVAIIVVNLPAERDRRVIRESLALESAGYRVTVICPRGTRGLRELPGTRDTAIRAFPQPFAGSGVLSFAGEFAWSFLCVTLHLLRLLVTDRVDAAQACNPPDVFWPLALLMRLMGKPFVFDHHDLSPELYRAKTDAPNAAVLRVLTVFEQLSMRCASWVLSTNESYREIAVGRGGQDPARVTVVRNGPASSEITHAATPSEGGRKRIVYLGVINPQDNVRAAVLAASRLAEMRGRDDWEMVIAGDGDSLPELRALATDLGLDDVVYFAGWLGGDEVDALLASGTIGIQPDQPDPMSNLSTMAKTVEYVARGLPVVAVDLLETRRTAEGAAVYTPSALPEEFAKALDALLDDPDGRARMREIGLQRFHSRLAWEHQAAAYLSVWRELVPVAAVPAVPRQREAADDWFPFGDEQTTRLGDREAR